MKRRPDKAADAPLLAWGDALRAAKTRRSQLRRRIAIGGVGIVALLASAVFPPKPRLVWNASASAPIGLYAVTPGVAVELGDMVVARVPETHRRLAAERRYLPMNVPLVKRAAGIAGDEVCALGREIFVNGRRTAERRLEDGQGRPMPMWSGCIRLHGHQLFLLMDNPASFDGRYFGATEGRDIIGKARLLWRR
jgi:conjugative transfer signal peptidase TraF